MGSFSEGWKISKVAPMFKAGVKSGMCNYRPTSVLSTVARVFERLVYGTAKISFAVAIWI